MVTFADEYSPGQFHKGRCEGLQGWSSNVTVSFRWFMQHLALHMGTDVFWARLIWLFWMCFSVTLGEFHMALFLFLHHVC